MRIDYEALEKENDNFYSDFKSISDNVADIEKEINFIVDYRRWNGKARDYYGTVYVQFKKDLETVEAKFVNITDYLSAVIDSYKQLDSSSTQSKGGNGKK